MIEDGRAGPGRWHALKGRGGNGKVAREDGRADQRADIASEGSVASRNAWTRVKRNVGRLHCDGHALIGRATRPGRAREEDLVFIHGIAASGEGAFS